MTRQAKKGEKVISVTLGGQTEPLDRTGFRNEDSACNK